MMNFRKILAIGAHPDDIELSAGGFLLRQIEQGSEVYVVVITDGEQRKGDRRLEQFRSSKKMGATLIGCGYLDMEDGFLRHDADLITILDNIIYKLKPDLILTHSEEDYNQDHIAVARAAKSANRHLMASMIAFPNGSDIFFDHTFNLVVDISRFAKRKGQVLGCFKSQKDRWYLNPKITLRDGFPIAKNIERLRIEFIRL